METQRELTAEELAFLQWILEHGPPETQQYLPQLVGISAKSGCSCGCPSIDLECDSKAPQALYRSHILLDLVGKTCEGYEVGVLLFTEAGYLKSLEIYDFGEHDEPFTLPLVETLRNFKEVPF